MEAQSARGRWQAWAGGTSMEGGWCVCAACSFCSSERECGAQAWENENPSHEPSPSVCAPMPKSSPFSTPPPYVPAKGEIVTGGIMAYAPAFFVAAHQVSAHCLLE